MITVEIIIYDTQNIYKKQLHKEKHVFSQGTKIAVARGFEISGGKNNVKTKNLIK